METEHLNIHDEHFSVLSQLYDQTVLDSTDSSLLEIMQDDFSFQAAHLANTNDMWDNGLGCNDIAVLPMAIGVEGSQLDSQSKEDFQRMLSDWHDHLGTMQVSDNDDMDVKDIVGMEMVMPKTISEELPNLFDNNCELKPVQSPEKLFLSTRSTMHSSLGLSLTFSDNLNSFSLENFLEDDDEEEQKFGLIVAEGERNVKECEEKVEISSKSPESVAKDEVTKKTEKRGENIKVIEVEDDSVDVETIVEQIPVLEAGDLKSLLEQFEASEAFNSNSSASDTPDVPNGNSHVAVDTPQPVKQCNKKNSQTNQENPSVLTHEKIRDSLPKEVIDRIKASNRKKTIPVIPAMPSKRAGRGATRMQDAAATLNRNKLLKIVSGSGKGESFQLDHDYCSYVSSPNTDAPPPKSFYHSNASEYTSERTKETKCSKKEVKPNNMHKEQVYSRLPDYYVVLAPQKAGNKNKKGSVVKDDCWDKNSRKDSGLESGDVSDASEEIVVTSGTASTQDTVCTNVNSVVPQIEIKTNVVSSEVGGYKSVSVNTQTIKCNNSERNVPNVILSAESQRKMLDWGANQGGIKSKPTAMVSVLKKSQVNNVNHINSPPPQKSLLINSPSNIQGSVNIEAKKPEGPKKRKLNLEEYRSRLKELDRSRNNVIKVDSATVTETPSSTPSPNGNTTEVVLEARPVSKEGADAEVKNTAENKSEDKVRPVMHSVEVQTQTSSFEEAAQENGKQHERRSRKQQRKYRSQRASSSSSSHSGSSSNSHRHRKRSLSRRRRRSKRRSSGDRSASSSGSRRSRSNSPHSSSSYSSYSSRSRSRSRSPEGRSRQSPSRSHSRSSYYKYGFKKTSYNNWRSRSRSPVYGRHRNNWMLSDREKQRQVEERRVIYVGRIDEGTSKAELRRRFERFGPIIDISVHFREHGDNYGFVTFAYKVDAYEAIEHGNDDESLPQYDLCFGGRRAFCKTRYADLDGMATADDQISGVYPTNVGSSYGCNTSPEDFDLLLREAQAKLRKRKV